MPTLRDIREAEGLTDRNLARVADVSPSTVFRIERGHWSGMAVRRKLAAALGVEVDEIDWPTAVANNGKATRHGPA